nr:MAG TPA: hypothetical protein [Caudoviricetes sp.]
MPDYLIYLLFFCFVRLISLQDNNNAIFSICQHINVKFSIFIL